MRAVGMAIGLLAATLRSRPLVWLGAVSYCIYLVNEPVQKLLGVTLALVVQGDATLFTALWLPGAVVLPILAAWCAARLDRGAGTAPGSRHGATRHAGGGRSGQRRMNVQ